MREPSGHLYGEQLPSVNKVKLRWCGNVVQIRFLHNTMESVAGTVELDEESPNQACGVPVETLTCHLSKPHLSTVLFANIGSFVVKVPKG